MTLKGLNSCYIECLYKHFHRRELLVKKIILWIGALSTLSVLCSTAVADDWEYRSSYKASIPFGKDVKLKLAPELRYQDNFSRYYRGQVEVGIGAKIADWFVLEANYRVIRKHDDGEWQREIRPHLNAIFSFELFGLKFSDRNRAEFKMKEDEEYWRYRNKLGFSLPEITSLKITPCFAEEIFYDFSEDKLNKNRLYFGLEFQIVESLELSAEYIWENVIEDDGSRTSVNVIKTTLKYEF